MRKSIAVCMLLLCLICLPQILWAATSPRMDFLFFPAPATEVHGSLAQFHWSDLTLVGSDGTGECLFRLHSDVRRDFVYAGKALRLEQVLTFDPSRVDCMDPALIRKLSVLTFRNPAGANTVHLAFWDDGLMILLDEHAGLPIPGRLMSRN